MTPPPSAAAAAAPATAPRSRPQPRRAAPKRKRPATKRQAASKLAAPRRTSASAARNGRPAMNIYRSNAGIPAFAGRAGVAAAGRVGVVVRDLPDSGIVHRLTRGRAWIAVLGGLLVGIVALNVASLGLTTSSGTTGAQISELQTSNSALRSELAEKLSAPRVQAAASTYGLVTPPADDITYLNFKSSDFGRALQVLAGDVTALVAPWTPSSTSGSDSSGPSGDTTDSGTSDSTSTGSDSTSAPSSTSDTGTSSTTPSTPAPSTSSPSSSSSGGVGAGPGL
jgi:hypothetical protein